MKLKIVIGLIIVSTLRLFGAPLEEMEYILRFGFIKGGKATLVAEYENLNRVKTIHYHVRGRTVGIVDKIYEVNDEFKTWVDTATLLPVQSERIVKEQNYRFYDKVTYNRTNDSIFSLKSGAKKVPYNTNDLISVFFYLRQNKYLKDLLAGKTVEIPVFHGSKLFVIKLKYSGLETIETLVGKKLCYVVQPEVPEGKLFVASDALKIYITTDGNLLPIYAEFELAVGALKCELKSYKIKGVNQMIVKQ
jgi:hypothetical protein